MNIFVTRAALNKIESSQSYKYIVLQKDFDNIKLFDCDIINLYNYSEVELVLTDNNTLSNKTIFVRNNNLWELRNVIIDLN
tara:strand:- start:90 stop:332 length:243 start_codon:yes stop_codon:yes gene_type:complete